MSIWKIIFVVTGLIFAVWGMLYYDAIKAFGGLGLLLIGAIIR